MNAEEVRIFLCYAREDIVAVKAVYQKLADAGYYPWMDKKDLLPGQNWQVETPMALKAAQFVILFFSEHSVSKRGYVQREFKLALDTLEEMPVGQVYIIPVRLDDCEVPESFGHIHYCDLFEEDGLELVLKTIKSQLHEPAQAEEVGIPLEEYQRVLKDQEAASQREPKQPPSSPETEKTKKIFLWAGLIAAIIILTVVVINYITPDSSTPQSQTLTPQPQIIDLFNADNFVEIPAGSFQIGSENGTDDEKPVHTVRITKSFYMGKHEVTQEQWEAIMSDNPSHFRGKNLPVERVSWNEVQKFLRRLNNEMSRELFRLPTEAEWEYACRAGTKGDFAGIIDDMTWYDDNSYYKTHQVGTKQPNTWGLYDMHGNVREWCQDWYGNYSSGTISDPTGPATGSGRVIRGGGWLISARFCRSAYRFSYSPGRRSSVIGFRLVRTAP